MIKIVKFDEVFLKKSWTWLNDPIIKQMTNTPQFSKEDQRKWFHTLHGNKKYKIWGITIDHKKIGACGLKNIAKNKAEYWGYIGEKEYWGKGYGKKIIELIEKKAKTISIKYIHLSVRQDNIRAVSLYYKAGFKKTKNKKDGIILMKKQI